MQTAARHRNENKHNPIAILPNDLMPRHNIMKIRIQTIDNVNASCGAIIIERDGKKEATIKISAIVIIIQMGILQL